jgi:hypothetical protein
MFNMDAYVGVDVLNLQFMKVGWGGVRWGVGGGRFQGVVGVVGVSVSNTTHSTLS